MTITLLRLDLQRIDALRPGACEIDGIALVEGGLPPPFIVDDARIALRSGKPPLWFAPYLFVDPDAGARGRVVGSAIFKDEPDDGWVEIGYGVAEACQRRGYATDGVFSLIRLAFGQPQVRAVYAETAVVNGASRRVVQKVGFVHAGQRLSDGDGLVDCWFVEA